METGDSHGLRFEEKEGRRWADGPPLDDDAKVCRRPHPFCSQKRKIPRRMSVSWSSLRGGRIYVEGGGRGVPYTELQ